MSWSLAGLWYVPVPAEKAYVWEPAPTVTSRAFTVWHTRCLLLSANLKETVVMKTGVYFPDGEVSLPPITRRRQGISVSPNLGSKLTTPNSIMSCLKLAVSLLRSYEAAWFIGSWSLYFLLTWKCWNSKVFSWLSKRMQQLVRWAVSLFEDRGLSWA